MDNKISSIYIAYAGGAFPGGLFGAGFNSRIVTCYAGIKEVTGTSSGAVNAVLLASGQAANGGKIWMDILEQLPKTYSLNPLDWVRNSSPFTVQEPVFNAIETKLDVENLRSSKIGTRILYSLAKGVGIKDDDKVHMTERIIWPFLYFNKIRDFYHVSLESIHAKDTNIDGIITKLQGACALIPVYGRPVKTKEGLIFDAAHIEDLGGVEFLLRDIKNKQESVVCVVTRYPSGSKKFQKREESLEILAKKYDFPVQNTVMVVPESKLPISGKYSTEQKELELCFTAGQRAADKFLNKFKSLIFRQ